MSRWDIKPAAVQGVLQRTVEVAGKLHGESTSYVEHVKSAAGNAGTLLGPCDAREGLVGMALTAYANSALPELQAVSDRAQTSVQGALDAALAYVQGDEEMAADLQKAAIRTAEPKTYGKYAEGRKS